MKFIRFLSRLLLLAVALATVLVVVAFVPAVQTWGARMALARLPGVHASLGSFSARFGMVELANLRLEIDGAVLTLPSVKAGLPIVSAGWNRKVPIQSLVAKGWTLDLSRAAEPKNARPQVAVDPETEGSAAAAQGANAPAQKVERVFRGILSGWALPCDASLDGVELEGDVLIAVAPGKVPVRLHVNVKGGGVANGREGAFAIDAAGTYLDSASSQATQLAGHGRFVVAMQSARTLNRIDFKADLSAKGRSPSTDITVSADMRVVRGADEETYTLDLSQGTRHLATVLAHFSDASRRLTGTWKIDLRDFDLAPLAAVRPLSFTAVAGEGEMDADAAFSRVHILGRLNIVADHLEILARSLEPLGTVTLDTRFDLARSGHSIRVDRLSLSLAGARPAAVVQSLQPFDFDERTRDIAVADPHSDWVEVSIEGFPLAWLSGVASGVTLRGEDAAGGFVVRTAKREFAIRTKVPFTASNVSLQRDGILVGKGLELSLSLLADYTAKGWQIEGKPFAVASAGRRVVTLEGKASQAVGAGRPIMISGTWNADFDAMAVQSAIPELSWVTARSASCDFSVRVATQTELEGKLAVIGRDAGDTISAELFASVARNGAVKFRVPIKIASGSSGSEVVAEGTWASRTAASRVNVTLAGKNVALEHLRKLAAPAAAIVGAPLTAGSSAGMVESQTPAGARDRVPFWGDRVGSVTLVFDRLKTGNDDINDVHATFDVDRGSVRLENGIYELPNRRLARVKGSISFDPAAEPSYRLKAATDVGDFDAAPLFGTPAPGQEAVFKGRFSVARTLTGSGFNLKDLIGHTQEEFRLTSSGGIIRLLKTNVSDSIPQPSAPVSDTLGTVGSMVGSLLGVKRDSGGSGVVRLAKNTESVLDFTYQIAEIGYKEITLTAIRGSDRTLHLVDMAMTAADERVTGSGQITYVEGLSLRAQPISVDLQLGVRGRIAELLSSAGLLSTQKDNMGYTMLKETIHFGGTLEHLDKGQWHDLLAKAASQKPDGGPKGSSTAASKK